MCLELRGLLLHSEFQLLLSFLAPKGGGTTPWRPPPSTLFPVCLRWFLGALQQVAATSHNFCS